MPYTVTSEPTTEPVTWAELQSQCRIDSDDEQTYGEALIKAARKVVETEQRRAFITQTVALKLDCFPEWYICIEDKIPIISVTSIVYVDSDGDDVTVDAADYRVDTASSPARIEPAWGLTWPQDVRDVTNAVTVTFQAGYGSAAAVPQTTKQAILLLASNWYQNREPVILGTIVAQLPNALRSLVSCECWGAYP